MSKEKALERCSVVDLGPVGKVQPPLAVTHKTGTYLCLSLNSPV